MGGGGGGTEMVGSDYAKHFKRALTTELDRFSFPGIFKPNDNRHSLCISAVFRHVVYYMQLCMFTILPAVINLQFKRPV